MKSASTETMDFDSSEITELQTQVRRLQLENDILRQKLENLESKVSIVSNTVQRTSQSKPKVAVEKLGCGCKGNCSSKACGCVKKMNRCNSTCKCNNAVCQNQVTFVVSL